MSRTRLLTTAGAPGAALLGVLLVAPFLTQVDATIVNVAIPSIEADFNASSAALEWVVAGYLVPFAVLLITSARLGRIRGYRAVFIGGCTLFALASLASALAPNSPVLIAARVAQGVGAALMYPQALTGIQLNFDGAARTHAVALLAIAQSLGAVSGQILGGVLVALDLEGSGWRAIFIINLPICVTAAIGAWRFLPRALHEGVPQTLDWTGVALLSVSLLLLLIPLTLGRGAGWPPAAWLALIACVPAFWLFLRSQVRSGNAAPLVNLPLLRRPAVSRGVLALLVASGTYYALLFTLAQYLQRGAGRGALFSGLILVPWVAAFGLAAHLMRMAPAALARRLPVIGCGVLALAYAALGASLTLAPDADILLIVLLALGGLGLGLNFSALIVHLANATPLAQASDISGLITTTAPVGGAVGVATLGSLYLAWTLPVAGLGAARAFAWTCFFMAAAAAVAALLAHASTRRPRSGSWEPSEHGVADRQGSWMHSRPKRSEKGH